MKRDEDAKLMKQVIVDRLDALESLLESLEEKGDYTSAAWCVTNARIEELTWVLGLFPN